MRKQWLFIAVMFAVCVTAFLVPSASASVTSKVDHGPPHVVQSAVTVSESSAVETQMLATARFEADGKAALNVEVEKLATAPTTATLPAPEKERLYKTYVKSPSAVSNMRSATAASGRCTAVSHGKTINSFSA